MSPKNFSKPLFGGCIPAQPKRGETEIIAGRRIARLGIEGLAKVPLGLSVPLLAVQQETFGKVEIILPIIIAFRRLKTHGSDR
jgi:hypothetical protein